MDMNTLGIKEINAYYSRHGGHRTAQRKNFANYFETAGRNAVLKSAVHSPGPVEKTAHTRASKETEPSKETAPDRSAASSNSEDTCCDKCRLTNQMMLRMLSGNLYTQSGLGSLGYSAVGSGALAAYQSLSKYLGSNLF